LGGDGVFREHSVLKLDRTSCWRVHQRQPGPDFVTTTGWIKSTTFHIRVLLFASSGGGDQASDVLSQLPFCFESLYRANVVVELSALPSKLVDMAGPPDRLQPR